MTEATICGGNPQRRRGSSEPVLFSMLSFGSREDPLSSGSRACVLGMHLGCPHWTWPVPREKKADLRLGELWPGSGGLVDWSGPRVGQNVATQKFCILEGLCLQRKKGRKN